MRAQELAIGRVPCLALRVTYVGELGWELYCRSEFGLALWDTLWEGGQSHGLVAGGYKAIDSLRLEKGYRVWGADITSGGHAARSRPRIRREGPTRATSSGATRSSGRRSPGGSCAA